MVMMKQSVRNGCVGGILIPILLLTANVLGIGIDLRRRHQSAILDQTQTK